MLHSEEISDEILNRFLAPAAITQQFFVILPRTINFSKMRYVYFKSILGLRKAIWRVGNLSEIARSYIKLYLFTALKVMLRKDKK